MPFETFLLSLQPSLHPYRQSNKPCTQLAPHCPLQTFQYRPTPNFPFLCDSKKSCAMDYPLPPAEPENPTAEFHPFPRLPAEIQSQILKEAILEAREPKIFRRKPLRPFLPPPFAICRSLRQEALRLARLWGCLFTIKCRDGEKWLYFDPEHQTLSYRRTLAQRFRLRGMRMSLHVENLVPGLLEWVCHLELDFYGLAQPGLAVFVPNEHFPNIESWKAPNRVRREATRVGIHRGLSRLDGTLPNSPEGPSRKYILRGFPVRRPIMAFTAFPPTLSSRFTNSGIFKVPTLNPQNGNFSTFYS